MEALSDQKILLVDDDQSIRLSLSYYFGKKCSAFVCRETAELALQHLEIEDYNIILCDYRLPGMDGLTFFQELHRLHSPALKILITAFGTLELAIEAIKLGVHDFILKPFNAPTVEQSLTRLLAKHGQETPAILVDGKTLEEIRQEPQGQQQYIWGRVHHKMNNILQGMLGNADMGLLELGEHNPVIKRFDSIINGIEQMMELVNEVDFDDTNNWLGLEKINNVEPTTSKVVEPTKKSSHKLTNNKVVGPNSNKTVGPNKI